MQALVFVLPNCLLRIENLHTYTKFRYKISKKRLPQNCDSLLLFFEFCNYLPAKFLYFSTLAFASSSLRSNNVSAISGLVFAKEA